jgi:hypothetical protein
LSICRCIRRFDGVDLREYVDVLGLEFVNSGSTNEEILSAIREKNARPVKSAAKRK